MNTLNSRDSPRDPREPLPQTVIYGARTCSSCRRGPYPVAQFVRRPNHRKRMRIHRTCNRCAGKAVRRAARKVLARVPVRGCSQPHSSTPSPQTPPSPSTPPPSSAQAACCAFCAGCIGVLSAHSHGGHGGDGGSTLRICRTCASLRSGDYGSDEDYACDEFLLLRHDAAVPSGPCLPNANAHVPMTL